MYDRLKEAVLYKGYEPKRREWELCDDSGYSLAHVYARVKHLPSDFPYYELEDDDGTTVLEVAATFGHLPVHVRTYGDITKIASQHVADKAWKIHKDRINRLVK